MANAQPSNMSVLIRGAAILTAGVMFLIWWNKPASTEELAKQARSKAISACVSKTRETDTGRTTAAAFVTIVAMKSDQTYLLKDMSNLTAVNWYCESIIK